MRNTGFSSIACFPGGLDGKASACSAVAPGSVPGLGRSPGEGTWQPTPVLLPGKFHGWRSLVGYSPWDWKSQTRLSNFTFFSHLSQTIEKGTWYICPLGHSISRERKHISANTGDDIEPHFLEDVSCLFCFFFFWLFPPHDTVGSHYWFFNFYQSSNTWHLLPVSTLPPLDNLSSLPDGRGPLVQHQQN